MKWSLLVVGLMVLPGCLGGGDETPVARSPLYFPDATDTAASDDMSPEERGCEEEPRGRGFTCVGVGFVDHVVVENLYADPTRIRDTSFRIWLIAGDNLEIVESTRYEGRIPTPDDPLRLEATVRATGPGHGFLRLALEAYRDTAPEDLPKKWPHADDGQGVVSYWVVD